MRNTTPMRQWGKATAVAILISLLSVAFDFWYQKGIDGIWCSEHAGDGFIGIAPPCPPSRPFDTTVLWLVPLVGAVASGLIPIYALRLVKNQPVAWLTLSVCVPFCVFTTAVLAIIQANIQK